MKKSIIFVLIAILLVFASFVGGFYTGRNQSLGSTQIFGLQPEATQPITTGTRPVAVTTGSKTPTVPTTGPTQSQPTAPTQPTQPTAPGLININTATAQQLDTLPGIGPKLAQAIIDYRTEYGDFEVPEDLLHVPGIGEKKLSAIIDLITTGG